VKTISKFTIGFAGLASILMFTWPLLVRTSDVNEAAVAQSVFIALMPLILLLVVAEFATGGIGSKQLALLGVLTALNAVVRMLGAGTAGIETAFFIVIIGAFVFGGSFGFVLGATSLLVSALLTGGVGPWLPFQMMAAGLVGLGAGLLKTIAANFEIGAGQKRTSRAELTLLSGYAVLASFVYGALMTMWNWPYLAGVGSSVSYVSGAPLLENLGRFLNYEIFTGGLLWDCGRAITTSLLIWLTAPALVASLRRAATRAGVEKLGA
jgi:energy-coupling factor transport system substrate-specific component